MATISSSEFKPVYTTLIAARYDEMLKARATGFLRSFFIDNITKVRYPSIDVRRGTLKVAANVILGHQGIRTQITKSTQKILDLFYFRYFFDATELDCYWNLFGSTSISENVMTEFVDGVAAGNKANQDLIERAYELFCAQILIDGTCFTLNNPTNIIDFGRKADSMVDAGAGNYWADAGVDPYAQIAEQCEFIVKNGLYTGAEFNMILSGNSFNDLLNNDVVAKRNDIKMWKLDNFVTPDMKVEGQTYHGTISCGPYTVHIWQYPQFYETAAGVKTPYLDGNYAIVLPRQTEFHIIYGATPQLVTPGAATASLQAAKYVLNEYIEQKSRTHEFHIESRGIPVPIAIDTISTRTTG